MEKEYLTEFKVLKINDFSKLLWVEITTNLGTYTDIWSFKNVRRNDHSLQLPETNIKCWCKDNGINYTQYFRLS